MEGSLHHHLCCRPKPLCNRARPNHHHQRIKNTPLPRRYGMNDTSSFIAIVNPVSFETDHPLCSVTRYRPFSTSVSEQLILPTLPILRSHRVLWWVSSWKEKCHPWTEEEPPKKQIVVHDDERVVLPVPRTIRTNHNLLRPNYTIWDKMTNPMVVPYDLC